MDIGFNSYQLIGKLIALIIFIGIVALFIFVSINPRGNQSLLLAPSAALLFFIFSFVFFIQILFLPIGVHIDDASMEIEIKFLLLKSKIVNVEDIDSYGSTLITTKSENYEGILLHLKSGKNLLLSDFNLKDYSPIKSFLEKSKIEDIGKEKFRFFSYYTQSFR